jgi:membrane protein DedA with SNARE-associated domain
VTEALLGLVPTYGAAFLFAVTFLGCLGVPISGSLALLAAGAFVGSGDIGAVAAVGAGFAGAVGGDQTGYWLGARGGPAARRFADRRGAGAALARAEAFASARGASAVFLTRWLLSPLGPATNLASGLIGMPWRRFTLAGASGEAVWVALYIGLGWAFADSIPAIADLAGSFARFLAAGAVTALIALRLARAVAARRAGAERGG